MNTLTANAYAAKATLDAATATHTAAYVAYDNAAKAARKAAAKAEKLSDLCIAAAKAKAQAGDAYAAKATLDAATATHTAGRR